MSDDARRFGGVQRLYGLQASERLRSSHVAIAGIGGVGSWCVEALARSGIGRMTLIDLDHVAESNINRQVHALESTLGAAKVEVMARRVNDISPMCTLRLVDEFLTADNLNASIGEDVDFVVDAIDQPRVKAALVAWCRARQLPMIVCGAAGGRSDPLALRREDLAATRGDALLSSVRSRLRREHQFPRVAGQKFGVPVIYSLQTPLGQGPAMSVEPAAGSALACSGYGSIVTVTAVMGFAAAQAAIDHLAMASTRARPGAVLRQEKRATRV